MSVGALPTVAAWDVAGVRSAVTSLAEVAERLPRWRFRIEAVGRSLDTADCWSGPAAQRAAAAVVGLSGATTAVAAGLDRSLAELRRLAAEASAAQELAVRALAIEGAAAPPALAHAAAAASAATAAATSLAGLGVVDAFAPARFDDLLQLLDTRPAGPPTGAGPDEVARWWAGLDEGAREALVATAPDEVGKLDGVPAWARDRANRLVLARALAHPHGASAPCAAAVAARLAEADDAGHPAQLYAFDAGAGLVALAFGDVDTADALAVLVPGVLTTAADDLTGLARRAQDVAAAARAAAPGLAVATIAWLGYRTPQNPVEIVTRGDARRGGRALDDALDGLAAARAAAGLRPARTTVVAHSYGTVVVDEAADRPGRLAADAVVLLGSPGMEPGNAACLEAPEVYDAAAALDPVSWAGWFGTDPWSARYGATLLPTDWDTLHWQYLDPGRPTLPAVGEVVAGRRHTP